MQKAARAYLQTQVTTTSQGQLLLMLYDAAINFLKQAKERMAERDFAKKGILISKALDIISELASSLNVQKGGDLAENLSRLYFYCNMQLLQANMKMDQAKVDEVVKILTRLRSAWQEIIETGGASASPGAQAAADALEADAANAGASVQPAQTAPQATLQEPPQASQMPQQPAAVPDQPQQPEPGAQPARARLLKAYSV